MQASFFNILGFFYVSRLFIINEWLSVSRRNGNDFYN
ncbi:hypothetical protein SAMN06273570_4126 [Candidatus Pantoea floridensis]|uniref:Uncharacterized protein n=1 Tax=Candidatus Pantoea floridensis TaxID=1938870 RepID=A0A286BZU9_9GAMM|nr:hypothetical protein BX596_1574 [Enterobacteriaceae bacterium JKS000233]SOD39673.1 hypothetical protein SAMN06273570_4126 [Pantoea floridensis]